MKITLTCCITVSINADDGNGTVNVTFSIGLMDTDDWLRLVFSLKTVLLATRLDMVVGGLIP